MKPIFDYSVLRGRIVEKFGSLESFAAALKMTATTLGRKMSNKSYWSQSEILAACYLLEILASDIPRYFFCAVS